MCIRYILAILVFVYVCPLPAQENDSLKPVILKEIIVDASYKKAIDGNVALKVHSVDESFLRERFAGNFIQTLSSMPGIASMDIGSGFSKPMIRGMAFNRIAVTENGIKQEGQQWGADHGLEIDAFNVERVNLRKGPSSLLYGSDAMGGVIEISRLPAPAENQVYGEAVLLGKSVNGTLGASAMLAVKKDGWHTKIRFSEHHFGDYRIPADTIVYLTQRLPVYGRKLKNTAGFERDFSLFSEFRKGKYHANFVLSDAFQKVGFFAGAHGIPDVSRLSDDADSRNIDLPYSRVNHLKISSRQQYFLKKSVFCWDLGFQQNNREELSRFHTHYGNQLPPETNPDRELAFSLITASSSLKADFTASRWRHTFGWDIQWQRNGIAGYSFLLPEYRRFATGGLWLSAFRPNNRISLSGGVRYDYGMTDIAAFQDIYLEKYLRERAYEESVIEAYKWRSYQVYREFGNFSASLGFSWELAKFHQIKGNLGRSFRLPGANELASNGVHHGTFRHEQGNAELASETGWQLDFSYVFERNGISLALSPFVSRFENWIYLKPVGEWSILPHAGQIYRYTGAEAMFAGAEIEFSLDLRHDLTYRISGEYVFTHNFDEGVPLNFSPPASMRNSLIYSLKIFQFRVELQSIATQNRVARNEDITQGVNLLHLGITAKIPLREKSIDLMFSLQNVLDTQYFNHLSFYRKVEIPEPGRNLQLLIKIPFKNILK